MRKYGVRMSGSNLHVILAAVVAASFVGLAGASFAAGSVSTDAQSSSTSFVLRQFAPTSFVDNPPKAGAKMNPSPGDLLTAASTVYDATGKRRLGRTSETLIVTVANPITMDTAITLILRSGDELLVRGAIDPTQLPWRAAVVGGYGRYAGARGWVRETSVAGGERMTVTLTG